jgi:hypothetical protein
MRVEYVRGAVPESGATTNGHPVSIEPILERSTGWVRCWRRYAAYIHIYPFGDVGGHYG